MAVPSYGHDLIDWIIDSDATAWSELVGMVDGGSPDEVDTESALQGTNTTSQITAVSGVQLFSQCRILTSPITLSSGQVFLVWHGHGVATALESYANGGLRIVVAGNSATNWKGWAVGGVDVPPFPYGKWVNNPIDPTITAEYSSGTPPTGGTNIYGVGSAGRLTLSVARGQPHVTDMIRYGRAEARISGGQLGNYATFAGFATVNDAQTARWGLIQTTTGGYLWKGLMTLGYLSAVDFRDSNKIIFIQDTRKVSSTFNKIEVRQVGSRVDWIGISFISLSPTTNASKGSFECIDNATINISNCTFTDMNTFIFKPASIISTSTFRRCGQITSGGANFATSIIDSYTGAINTSALIWNEVTDPNGKLNNMNFTKGTNAHHAIEFGTSSPTIITLAGTTFTGFNATNAQNDSMLHFKRTTGAITVNYSNMSEPTYKSDGAIITMASAASLTIVVVNDAGTTITDNCEITIVKNSDTTILFEEDNVVDGTITYSYGSGAGTITYINILNVVGYQPKTVNNFALPSGTSTLTVQLDTDPFYNT